MILIFQHSPLFQRNELVGFLDAAHATDLRTRRSVTGLVILFCHAAIAWKGTLQSLVATSSTEAELYAAVICAKIVKYLRYVLQELNALAPGPSTLFIDNEAALCMINEERPTPRARHVEVQHFAILEWRKAGDILMKHIPGILNPADSLTKLLGYVLHFRHVLRAMGYYRLASTEDFTSSPIAPYVRSETYEAREGVGAESATEWKRESDPVPRLPDGDVTMTGDS